MQHKPFPSLNAAKHSLLISVRATLSQGKKTYTQVLINKILELLLQFHGVHVGRRRVFQCLRELKDDGYISRQRRYLRLAGGLIRSIPSLWSLTPKGFKNAYPSG